MGPSQRATAVFGLGIAAFVTATFGSVWLVLGLSDGNTTAAIGWIVFSLGALVLLAAAIRTIRTGKALMAAHPAGRDDFWASRRRRFGLVMTLEGVGCGLIVLLTNVFHRTDLLAAGISLVVGIHFLPMASLFRFNAYRATGIAIVAGDLLIGMFARKEAMAACVGLATGTILWATAIYALRRSREFVQRE